MEDYKPNSYKSKMENAEPKKSQKQKVVKGMVKTKKKSRLTKFADVFIQEDISNVKEFIISDILIPTGKKLITDIVDSILYPGGSNDRSRKSGPASRVQYTSYDRFSSSSRDRFDRRERYEPRRTYEYNDLVFETRGDAEAVLMGMDETIDKYGIVTVADLYEFAEVSGSSTDNKYGWKDISSARVQGNPREGYIIKFPRIMAID